MTTSFPPLSPSLPSLPSKATSNAAYGAPIRSDLTATKRLARTDPVEYMHRSNFGDQTTMTATFHDDKHTVAMKQGNDLMDRNRWEGSRSRSAVCSSVLRRGRLR